MFRIFQAGKSVASYNKVQFRNGLRHFTNQQNYDAIVLGAYTDELALANTSDHISQSTRNSILEQLSASNFSKADDLRMLYNVGGISQVAVVSLGDKKSNQNQAAVLETARRAAGLGVQALKKQKATNVGVDVSIHAHGAAEGAVLAQFEFSKLKKGKDQEPFLSVGPFGGLDEASVNGGLNWETGQIYGVSQNLARMLMTTPANLMTPKTFSEEVAYLLAGLENIDIAVHDKEWAVRQKMNSFLSVAQGSDEPLRFLEIHYKGASESDPVYGLVGKGVTFDSGGISLKPSANMALMKGDMGGAATVCSAMYGISKLKLPVNVVAVTPLAENLPSGRATKPGDVVRAMNGKSIEVINTDAEGRLILADALYYLSSKYSLKSIIDVATLTGACDVALGQVFAGVFTNSDELWTQLNIAAQMTSDPFWRMPLHDDYLKAMKESAVADLVNSAGRSGGAVTAAMFLKEFLADKEQPWAHIDIAGVMDCSSTEGYHVKGMTGRPTRSLIEYLRGHTK
ncbi:cytosol aminopeptidase family, catalytic domain-containing protein [Zychaea mexicana]|uniref:cytosol aminopeptidase family, catalytic domain-containing protein n=1 Tax=Zychaea mexicana TaxID=64656 RepID=UPI0022FEB5B4|nr:cytosol aminopeptidase family, catalytic domain-containing protein [Zychaea mexicana]KAI9485018.1 cytosol aminopeptidase family, catalytic domain-containing protein [Zychaea mexicana]